MYYKYIILFISLFIISNCRESVNLVKKNKYKLVWEENFNNKLDTNYWNIEVKDAGWVNNELQTYTSKKQNLFVNNNKLYINALKEKYNNADYTSARITTQNKINWKYGYFEIRAKFDQIQGTWPAIWLLSERINLDGWPMCGEIDIMEHINAEYKIYGSLHSEKYNHMKGNNLGGSYDINSSFDEYNLYGLEWTKDKISWYVNDNLFYSIDKKKYFEENWPYDSSFFMIVNLAIGGNWPGPPLEDFKSSSFIIDWIKIYQ